MAIFDPFRLFMAYIEIQFTADEQKPVPNTSIKLDEVTAEKLLNFGIRMFGVKNSVRMI